MFNETHTTSTITDDCIATDEATDAAAGATTGTETDPTTAVEETTQVIEPAPRHTQRWQCPDCGNGITLHVRVLHAPICNNKAVHSRRHIEMKKQKKGNQQ